MNIIRESLHIRGGDRRPTAGLSEKKDEVCHGGVVVKAVVLKA